MQQEQGGMRMSDVFFIAVFIFQVYVDFISFRQLFESRNQYFTTICENLCYPSTEEAKKFWELCIWLKILSMFFAF